MTYLQNFKPRYTHDCDACRFLYQDGDMDIYWCMSSTFGGGSVIARMGNDGPDYTSSPVSVVLYSENDSAHTKALRKAVAYLAREGIVEVHINQNGVENWDDMGRDN